MTGTGRVRVVRDLPWTEPLSVAAGVSARDGALCLLSDRKTQGSRSFVAADPEQIRVMDRVEGPLFETLRDPDLQAGVVGLASYDAGARPATGEREAIWPDLILARYGAMLVFDHDGEGLQAIGWGADAAAAEANCNVAESWIAAARSPDMPEAPAAAFTAEAPPQSYESAVQQLVSRIAAGDLFQANIARAWTGDLRPAADPFDVFLRLTLDPGAASTAPYGAFWRIGHRALVSNSPELFVACHRATGRIETRPIKGTRPRRVDPVADAAEADALLASAKDRAENLMIVDLMRNDLARVCRAGSVVVDTLFVIESHPTVHHLVSTVSGVLAEGQGPAEVLQATFPPGSITGAPKHQAMKVIAGLEPPRGAWCGSLFVLDGEGDLTASVLIRTAAFERVDGGWRFRALAGAGIVADSDPAAELAETDAKISALRRALTGELSD